MDCAFLTTQPETTAMAKLTTHQIRELGRNIVANSKGGVRYGDLIEQIALPNPETPRNTIHGSVWDLHIRFPQQISKPSRGLFAPVTLEPPTESAPTEPLPLPAP